MEQQDFSTQGKLYQKKVVQALIEDPEWSEQMFEVMNETFFTETHLSVMVKTYFEYYREYAVFPDVETYMILLKDRLADGDMLLVKPIVNFCKHIKAEPLGAERVIIQDSAFKFCKRKALGTAILEMASRLQEEDFDAEAIVHDMQNAIHLGEASDLGHDYNDEMHKRHAVQERITTPTGYKLLDEKEVLNGGLSHGQIGVIMAPSGAGKSMMLVNLAANMLRTGRNVVYLTLELPESSVGIRFDANFSDLAQHDVTDKDAKDIVRNSISDNCTGKLRIKYFSAYTLTVGMIRNYLRRLENAYKFKTDVLIIDYADLMSSGQILSKDSKGYEGQGNNYVALRALGQELGMPVWTAVQTNRGGVSKEVLDKDDISEDFKKVMHADVILGLSRTKDDKLSGHARLTVVKNRNGRDGHWYIGTMDTSTTRFDIIQEADADLITLHSSRGGPEREKAAKNQLAKAIAKMNEDGGKKADAAARAG